MRYGSVIWAEYRVNVAPWSSLALLKDLGRVWAGHRELDAPTWGGSLGGLPVWLQSISGDHCRGPPSARSERRGPDGRLRDPRSSGPRPEPPPVPPAPAAAARPAHRDSVLERDALQRIAGADPVLHMALDDAGAQRRPHAGRAAVRAGLGAGQAQRQLGLLGLGARARARRRRRRRRGRGPGRPGAAFPQGQRGRGIRHGSCGGRQVAKLAKGAVPSPPPPLLPSHRGCGRPFRGGGGLEAATGSCGPGMAGAPFLRVPPSPGAPASGRARRDPAAAEPSAAAPPCSPVRARPCGARKRGALTPAAAGAKRAPSSGVLRAGDSSESPAPTAAKHQSFALLPILIPQQAPAFSDLQALP